MPSSSPHQDRKYALNGIEKPWSTVDSLELKGFKKIRKVFTPISELIGSEMFPYITYIMQFMQSSSLPIQCLDQCKFILSCLQFYCNFRPAVVTVIKSYRDNQYNIVIMQQTLPPAPTTPPCQPPNVINIRKTNKTYLDYRHLLKCLVLPS